MYNNNNRMILVMIEKPIYCGNFDTIYLVVFILII